MCRRLAGTLSTSILVTPTPYLVRSIVLACAAALGRLSSRSTRRRVLIDHVDGHAEMAGDFCDRHPGVRLTLCELSGYALRDCFGNPIELGGVQSRASRASISESPLSRATTSGRYRCWSDLCPNRRHPARPRPPRDRRQRRHRPERSCATSSSIYARTTSQPAGTSDRGSRCREPARLGLTRLIRRASGDSWRVSRRSPGWAQ